MKKICRILVFIALAAAAGYFFGLSQSQPAYSITEALKVQAYVDRLIVAEMQPHQGELRKISVTESEFNSYVAYLIDIQPDQPLKEVLFKMFDRNRIEAKIHMDLRGQKIPKIIRPEMNFYFSGDLEVKDKKVRVDLKDLFLEKQPIKPMIIDLVFMIAARITKSDSGSIHDWYDLPYGIKDIRVSKGKAEFFY